MSEILAQKMRTLFHRFDLNQDGRLTAEDFYEVGEAFVREGDLEGNDADNVREHLKKVNTHVKIGISMFFQG